MKKTVFLMRNKTVSQRNDGNPTGDALEQKVNVRHLRIKL